MELDVAMRGAEHVDRTLASADRFISRNYKRLHRVSHQPYLKGGKWWVHIVYQPKEGKQ